MHQYMVKYHQTGVQDALISLKTGYDLTSLAYLLPVDRSDC